MCQTNLKMSSESEKRQKVADNDVTEQLTSLKDKISRTTKFLKELRTLSKACQEITSCGDYSNHAEDTDDDAIRERQVIDIYINCILDN